MEKGGIRQRRMLTAVLLTACLPLKWPTGLDWLAYRTGRKVYVQVGDGGFIPVYLHDLEIQIGKHRLTAPLGFSDKLGIRFNLLGRTGIFGYFKTCFDERDFVLTFSPYET